jgi:hypothetical protein
MKRFVLRVDGAQAGCGVVWDDGGVSFRNTPLMPIIINGQTWRSLADLLRAVDERGAGATEVVFLDTDTPQRVIEALGGTTFKTTPPTSGVDPTKNGADRTEEPEVGGAQLTDEQQKKTLLEYADALHELSQFMLTRGRVQLDQSMLEAVPAATALILELEARCSKRAPTGMLPSERVTELMTAAEVERGWAGSQAESQLRGFGALLTVLDERLGRAAT